ncbi:MAG: hypothetical protein ACE5I7_16285 [Candidatus Binatia bacterium]
MQPVSSVTAFLSRCFTDPDLDSPARTILADALTATERRVLELRFHLHDPAERLRQLREETSESWSAARFDRVEELALTRLRRALAQRGLLQA